MGGRYGIVPTGMPGMAAAQATQGQPATTQEAMVFDGFLRVAGTAGVEATVIGHQRADGVAVKLDQ